jgi:hypothetical protein
MQTADAVFYYPLLQETAKTVRGYCLRHGFNYEQYVGIKRGNVPWQASYNRVYMLKEMIDRGVEGWVLYLDADAYIHDMDFDLAAYLEERSDKAAIFAGYSLGTIPYDINSGGFAVNLSHPVGKSLVLDWYETVRRISDEHFAVAIHWQHDLANDQHLLFQVLENYVENLDCGGSIIFERSNQSYVNSGPFIRQHLRSMYDSFDDRMRAVSDLVGSVANDLSDVRDNGGPGMYLQTTHSGFLTSCGRRVANGVETTGAAGGLLFGPYTSAEAGRYHVRLFGKARPPVGASFDVVSDVAARRGHVVYTSRHVQFDKCSSGLLIDYPLVLDEDVDDLEIRITVEADADMIVSAVQLIPVG